MRFSISEKKTDGYVVRYARWFLGQSGRRLRYGQQYFKGLFYHCRSNIERIEEQTPNASYDTLHPFISESTWDGPGVMGQVAREVQATLAGEQGLLLDECG